MAGLGVIGNISRDTAEYPDGRRRESLGGAALHVALAAATAGLPAAPVSVIGPDLAWIKHDSRLAILDLRDVRRSCRASCTFRMTYDLRDELVDTACDFGAAHELTDHAMDALGRHASYHVCCRRPLDAARVLGRLMSSAIRFSVDFHVPSAQESILAASEPLRATYIVFANQAEYHILTRLMPAQEICSVIVTDGAHTARMFRRGELVAAVNPRRVTATDVTGAGDTLTGSFLAAKAAGLSDLSALQRAVRTAAAFVRGCRIRLEQASGG